MANIIELFALVEMTLDVASQQPTAPTIKRIIRTYESNNRAQSDLELLNDAAPGPVYFIVTVQHIES